MSYYDILEQTTIIDWFCHLLVGRAFAGSDKTSTIDSEGGNIAGGLAC